MTSRRPNLLIVMVDQMQADLLDDEPPIRLAHLQRLRDHATRFTHAFCPAPICTPTRASFQLAQSVAEHAVVGNNRPMPPGPTLATRLNNAGYRTAYVGKWHLDRGDPRGWTTHDPVRTGGVEGHHVMAGPDTPHAGVDPGPVADHVDGRVAARAHAQLEGLQRQPGPWALMISFYGPHAPYYLPAEWHGRFDPASIPLPDDFDAPMAGKPDVQSTFRCRAWGERWSAEKWRHIRAAYFGYGAMLDQLIGDLLNRIDLARTAVLVLSDHGEMNGKLRMIYKGPMMYDALTRVPVLLAGPAIRSGDDDRLVQTQDLTQTLLGLADAKPLPGDGRDLYKQAIDRDAVVSEFHEANWVDPVVHQRVAMLRDRDWKYVITEGDTHELYDMRPRPVERDNLIDHPTQRDRVARMHRRLTRDVPWVASVPIPLPRD